MKFFKTILLTGLIVSNSEAFADGEGWYHNPYLSVDPIAERADPGVGRVDIRIKSLVVKSTNNYKDALAVAKVTAQKFQLKLNLKDLSELKGYEFTPRLTTSIYVSIESRTGLDHYLDDEPGNSNSLEGEFLVIAGVVKYQNCADCEYDCVDCFYYDNENHELVFDKKVQKSFDNLNHLLKEIKKTFQSAYIRTDKFFYEGCLY